MIRYVFLALLALALLITAAVAFTLHFVEKRRVRRAASGRAFDALHPETAARETLRPDEHPANDHRHDSAGFIVDQLSAQGQQTGRQNAQGQQRTVERGQRDLGRSLQQVHRDVSESLRDAISGFVGRPNPGAVNVEIRTVQGDPDQVVADILRQSIRETQANQNQQPTPAEQRRMADVIARRVGQQLGSQGAAPVTEEPRPEPKTRFQRDPVI